MGQKITKKSSALLWLKKNPVGRKSGFRHWSMGVLEQEDRLIKNSTLSGVIYQKVKIMIPEKVSNANKLNFVCHYKPIV